jgi:hypothetical protein
MKFIVFVLSLFLFAFPSCLSFVTDAFTNRPEFLHGFMNLKGKIVIPQIYEDSSDFSQGLAPVKKDGLWGYINAKGEIIIPFQFEGAGLFSNDPVLAPAQMANATDPLKSWGFIDMKGNWVIPPSYYYATPFREGVAEVSIGKYKFKQVSYRSDKYFLTKEGKLIYHNGLYSYASGPNFVSEGLFPSCKEGKWGYKDISNKWVIEPKYSMVSTFRNGRASVKTLNSHPYKDCELIPEAEPLGFWGYIDRAGKEIIPLKYRAAGDFVDGIALVDQEYRKNEFIGAKLYSKHFIDTEGKDIFGMTFRFATDFSKFGYAYVGEDEKNTLGIEPNKRSFVDRKGKLRAIRKAENEEIEFIMPGSRGPLMRVTLKVKPEQSNYENRYVTRFYNPKELTQAIPIDFDACFGQSVSPYNCRVSDFQEGLARIIKVIKD